MERKKRDDEWTPEEDEMILSCALKAIEDHMPLTDAFVIAGEKINRTYGAVRFRYYNMIKHNHNHVIKIANTKRVQRINSTMRG